MKWMEAAWSELGTAEIAGAGNNDRVLQYFRDVGRADVKTDETPWCAAFVGSCLGKAGIDTGIAPASILLAASYAKVGTPCDQPRVGAVAVIDVGTATQTGRHVGLVSGWTDDTVQILGGNQGDAVSVATFRRDRIVALRWPAPEATVSDLAKAGSRTVNEARGQIRDVLAAGGAAASGVASQAVAPVADMPATNIISWTMQLEKFGMFAVAKWHWVAAAVAAWLLAKVVVRSGLIADARVQDHNTGANTARGAKDAAVT